MEEESQDDNRNGPIIGQRMIQGSSRERRSIKAGRSGGRHDGGRKLIGDSPHRGDMTALVHRGKSGKLARGRGESEEEESEEYETMSWADSEDGRGNRQRGGGRRGGDLRDDQGDSENIPDWADVGPGSGSRSGRGRRWGQKRGKLRSGGSSSSSEGDEGSNGESGGGSGSSEASSDGGEVSDDDFGEGSNAQHIIENAPRRRQRW